MSKKISDPLFQGEMMKCKMCGRQQKSDAKIKSNWTAIEVPDTKTVIYLCPKCFRLALS